MAEGERRTAFAVFGKMDVAKRRAVAESSYLLSTAKMGEREIIEGWVAGGFNAIEAQLAILVARDNAAYLASLAAERREAVRQFTDAVGRKAVGADKILAAMQGIGFDEESGRQAVDYLRRIHPSQVLTLAPGRGDDDFSNALRQEFSRAVDEAILTTSPGQEALIQIARHPDRTIGLGALLRALDDLTPGLKAGRPIWWGEMHQKMLLGALGRRLPVIFGEPLRRVFHDFPAGTEEEVVRAFCEKEKIHPAVPDLFLKFVYRSQDEGLTTVPEVDSLAASDLDVFHGAWKAWIFFAYETKGSAGWRQTAEWCTRLAERILEVFPEGDATWATRKDLNRDLWSLTIAALADTPQEKAQDLAGKFRLGEPTCVTPAARTFRYLHSGAPLAET